MAIYEKIGITVKEEKNDRFVADDFYRQDQCKELANFANVIICSMFSSLKGFWCMAKS